MLRFRLMSFKRHDYNAAFRQSASSRWKKHCHTREWWLRLRYLHRKCLPDDKCDSIVRHQRGFRRVSSCGERWSRGDDNFYAAAPAEINITSMHRRLGKRRLIAEIILLCIIADNMRPHTKLHVMPICPPGHTGGVKWPHATKRKSSLPNGVNIYDDWYREMLICLHFALPRSKRETEIW